MSVLPHGSPAGSPADAAGDGCLSGEGREALCDLLAADWVTIWQSELAGLAADRESAEHMRAAIAAWMAAVSAQHPHEPANSRSARPDVPAGAAPAAAASDAGETIARLEQRVAELERRLAAG